MNKIKKVLFVVSIYKPNMGGVETSVESYCKEYKQRGIETVILTKRYPLDLPGYDIYYKTKVIRVLKPDTDEQYISTLNTILSDRRLKADLIHVVGVRRPLPLFALLLARHYKIPVIMTFVGGDVPTGISDSENQIWEERKNDTVNSILQADGYSAYSDSIVTGAKKLMPLNRDIKVLKTGIDIELINKVRPNNNEDKYILSARRLLYDKGIDILINAFNIVIRQIPDLKLYIAGEGEEKENLEKMVRDLKINNNVKFIGTIPLEVLYSYMKGASCHICPSRTEGGGNVNIEASACGCIPIGADVGGIREYIKDGITGLLFDKENAEHLADRIISVVNKKIDIENMKKNGFIFADEFSIKTQTTR